MRERTLKPWHGAAFFLLVMIVFFVICVPLQSYFGLYGVAVTEIILLIMALIFAKVMGHSLRSLFPVYSPEGLPMLGIILMWISVYILTMVVSLIQYRLFPRQMEAVSGGLDDVIYSVPFWVSIIVVAVLPAICEEAVHRGVIIHTMYRIRKEWLVVLIMGIYFGLFHANPLRFLPTAILGAAMSYIMLETENMVYSSAFHMVNNLLPMLLQEMLLKNSQVQQAQNQLAANDGTVTMPLVSIGVYLILGAAAPFGMYLGNYLLHRRGGSKPPFFPKEQMDRTVLKIAVPSAVLFIAGSICFGCGIYFESVL